MSHAVQFVHVELGQHARGLAVWEVWMVRGHASFTSAEEARMTRLESWSGRGAAERSGRVDMARGPREVFDENHG